MTTCPYCGEELHRYETDAVTYRDAYYHRECMLLDSYHREVALRLEDAIQVLRDLQGPYKP